MKILELCTSKGWGGLELYVWQVSKWLRSQQHECLAVIERNSLLEKRMLESNIQTDYLKPAFRQLPLLAARHLARLIDRQQIDIMHVHWNKDLILAVLAKRFARRNVKLVFLRHMALTRHKRDFYHRFIYLNIDKYLVITRKLYEEARTFLPVAEKNLQILYHGVADFPLPEESSCRDFLTEHKLGQGFKILLPGRIEHYKGQHTLVDAVVQLHAAGLDVELVILGHVMDQKYFRNLQQQIEKAGLEKKISYLGFVDNPTAIYGCFDLVVLTTYAETFGLVLVEAMKSGVAVIGTNAGGVPEIIEHEKTGLLYESGNVSELAACVRRLAEDSDFRTQLARAGKEYADRVFSEQQHYSTLTTIFAGLVNNKSEQA